MARSCPKSVEKIGSALFSVLVCLAIGSGVMAAQTLDSQTPQARGALQSAQRTLAEADKLKSEWKSESLKLAARKYAKAQELFHLGGETRLETESLEKLGDVSAMLSDYQSAVVHY